MKRLVLWSLNMQNSRAWGQHTALPHSECVRPALKPRPRLSLRPWTRLKAAPTELMAAGTGTVYPPHKGCFLLSAPF